MTEITLNGIQIKANDPALFIDDKIVTRDEAKLLVNLIFSAFPDMLDELATKRFMTRQQRSKTNPSGSLGPSDMNAVYVAKL